MGNGLLYVCKQCGSWVILNPVMTLEGCPYCKGELHHVPINMDQYNGWSEEIQRAFQYNYLTGKYNDGVPPVPGLKPNKPVASAPAKKQEAPVRQEAKPAAQPKQKKSSGCGGAFLSLILRVVIGIVIFFLFTGGASMLSKYNGLQREANISLNAVVRGGGSPSVGSYVQMHVRWAAGPFATETSTYSYGSRYSSSSGLTSTVSEKKFYYLILDDGTVMALETTNAQEIEALDRINTWLMGVNGFPDNGEMFTVQGEIKLLDDYEIRSYFDKHLESFGLASGGPNIRYLTLDTTAGREMLYIVLGGAAALLVIVLIIVSVVKKKKKKQAAAA